MVTVRQAAMVTKVKMRTRNENVCVRPRKFFIRLVCVCVFFSSLGFIAKIVTHN